MSCTVVANTTRPFIPSKWNKNSRAKVCTETYERLGHNLKVVLQAQAFSQAVPSSLGQVHQTSLVKCAVAVHVLIAAFLPN